MIYAWRTLSSMTVYDLLDAADWFQSPHIAETRSLFLHATPSPRERHMMPVPNSSMWRFSPTQVSQMEGWTHLRNTGRHRSNRTLRQNTGCPLSGILTSRRWEEELKAWVLSASTRKAVESHRQCCWLTVPTTQSLAIDQMATLIQPKKTAFSVWGRRSKAGLSFSNKLSNRFHVVLEIKSWKVQELEFMQLCSLDLFWQLPLKPMDGWHPATWPEVRKDWGTGQWSVKRRNLGGCAWRTYLLFTSSYLWKKQSLQSGRAPCTLSPAANAIPKCHSFAGAGRTQGEVRRADLCSG